MVPMTFSLFLFEDMTYSFDAWYSIFTAFRMLSRTCDSDRVHERRRDAVGQKAMCRPSPFPVLGKAADDGTLRNRESPLAPVEQEDGRVPGNRPGREIEAAPAVSRMELVVAFDSAFPDQLERLPHASGRALRLRETRLATEIFPDTNENEPFPFLRDVEKFGVKQARSYPVSGRFHVPQILGKKKLHVAFDHASDVLGDKRPRLECSH